MTDEGDRNRATMVLFAFERELGRMLIRNSVALRDLALSTQIAVGTELVDDTKAFVQESYVQDLLQRLCNVELDPERQASAKELLQLWQALKFGEIRNTCAHPNRPFSAFQWQCVKMLASHPAVMSLEAKAVVEALAAAEADTLTPPPEAWLDAIRQRCIPTNVDALIESRLPTYVGRSKEIADLKKAIMNPRFPVLAVTGTGGTGKTALVLESLKRIRVDPDALRMVDRIVFVSAKSELATLKGVINQDPDFGDLDSLKRAVVCGLVPAAEESLRFEEVVGEFGEDSVLLCVDNMEDVLLDKPETFSSFNEVLPPSWRVIVTSRVAIEDASKTIVLREMDQKDRTALANVYSRDRGVPLAQSVVQEIGKKCETPLMVRLAIDAVRLGGSEVVEAIQRARVVTAEYSFSSIVSQLDAIATKTLDALHVVGEPLRRTDLCHLLGTSVERMEEVIRTLVSSGLVEPLLDEAVARYAIGENVRVFLVDCSDHDRREFRQEILRRRNRDVAALAQVAIPDRAESKLELIQPVRDSLDSAEIATLRRALVSADRGPRALSRAHGMVEALLHAQPKNRSAIRVLSHLKFLMDDRIAALELLQPLILNDDVSSQATAAWMYKEIERLDRARELAGALVLNSDILGSSVERVDLRRRILQTYVLSSIWLAHERGKIGRESEQVAMFQEVDEFTSGWSAMPEELRDTGAGLRVTYLRRGSELCSLEEKMRRLRSAMELLESMFQKSGDVLLWMLKEALNLVHEITWLLKDTRSFAPEFRDERQLLEGSVIAFCLRYGPRLVELDRNPSRWLERFRSVRDAASSGSEEIGAMIDTIGRSWSRPIAESDVEALVREGGFVVARITNAGTAPRGFVFAAREGVDYFIPEAAFPSHRFPDLRVGSRVALNPGDGRPERGRAIPVTQAFAIEDRP